MTDKSIVDIELDCSAFEAFRKKYAELQKAAEALSDNWAKSAEQATKQKSSFEKMLELIPKIKPPKMDEPSKDGTLADDVPWVTIATSGKHVLQGITHATLSLAKWTSLTSVFGSLIGAGGLYGINRMAPSISQRRRAASEVGATPGEVANFETQFERLGIGEEYLARVNELQRDPMQRHVLYGVGGKEGGRKLLGESTTDAGADMLPMIQKLAKERFKDPKQIDSIAQAYGLDPTLVLTLMALPEDELQGLVEHFHAGNEAFKLTPDVLLKWTDLHRTFEEAGGEIEVAFQNKLVLLTPEIGRVAEHLGFIIDSAIREGSQVDQFIKGPLKSGIARFGEIMESGQFREGTENFLQKSLTAVHLVESIGWGNLLSGYLTFKGAQIGARIGGAVGGLPGAIVGGTIGAMAGRVGGPGVEGGSTPQGEPDDVVKRFGGGGKQAAPAPSASPQSNVPKPNVNNASPQAAPSPSGFSAAPVPSDRFGTMPPNMSNVQARRPADRQASPASHTGEYGQGNMRDVEHPRRYQGMIDIDGQKFDYATGSERRGRGSSPYGDHPLLGGYDPSALGGRGAYRTQDVYDPQVRDKRGAVEIHASRQDDVNRIETASCFGIPASEWPQARNALDKYIASHGGATLRVYPDGHAEVVPRSSPTPTEWGKRDFNNGGVTGARGPQGNVSRGDPAAVAESVEGLRDRDPEGHRKLMEYLRTGGHGMDPADKNWCASFVSASLHHAGVKDIPQDQGGDIATKYMKWGTAVDPKDVQRGDVMIGGTQGHRPGDLGGHMAIVTGPVKEGRIPIIEGDQRDDPTSYARNPGSAYSTTTTGPAYEGGHHVGKNTVPLTGPGSEGLMFRRPPKDDKTSMLHDGGNKAPGHYKDEDSAVSLHDISKWGLKDIPGKDIDVAAGESHHGNDPHPAYTRERMRTTLDTYGRKEESRTKITNNSGQHVEVITT